MKIAKSYTHLNDHTGYNKPIMPVICSDGHEGICGENSGIYVSANNYYSAPNARSIQLELKMYDIPDDIKRTANDLYIKSNVPIKRGEKNRKLLHYYFINCAYNKIGITFNPHYLAETIGIDSQKIRTAISEFSRYDNCHRDKRQTQTPLDFIEDQFPCTNLCADALPNIIEIATDIINKDSDLLDERPQNVSSAIIIYYMKIHGIKTDRSFFEQVHITEGSLRSMCEWVAKIHNS